MKVKLVYGLMIAGLLISQISLASPGFSPDKAAQQYQNNAIDSSEQPYPSDSDADSNFIAEGDNDPVKVYAC